MGESNKERPVYSPDSDSPGPRFLMNSINLRILGGGWSFLSLSKQIKNRNAGENESQTNGGVDQRSDDRVDQQQT